MKRCSFCEWIPILPWPVWPLAEQCSLGQNVVVGSMLVLQVALGNVPRGVYLDPRLHYKCTSPRLPAELPLQRPGRKIYFVARRKHRAKAVENVGLGVGILGGFLAWRL